MAPKKWLGVGAECTVSLRFLHPKDKIVEKIPNQTKSQKLSVLVVQEREEKPIRCKATQCVMFRYEDFSGQLLWCMEKYIKVDVEGPKETFFDAIHVEATQGQEQAMQSNNNGGGQEEAVKLPQAILDVIQNPHLDVDDIRAAGNVALMVDDDNMPAVKNIPQQDTNNNNNNNDIMSGWQHSGICECCSAIRMNATPMLKSLNTSDEMNDPTNLQLFEALFFKSFIQSTIIPKTNDNLGGGGGGGGGGWGGGGEGKSHLWQISSLGGTLVSHGYHHCPTETRFLVCCTNHSFQRCTSLSWCLDVTKMF